MRTANPYKKKRRKPAPPTGVTAEFQQQAALARDELRARTLAEHGAAPNDVQMAEYAHLAFELRRRGANYGTITKTINTMFTERGHASVSRAWVVELVASYINALDAETREPTKIVKRLEVERLDAILWGTQGTDGVFERARRGDDKAIDRFLALQERRLALMGVPINKLIIEGRIQHEHSIVDPVERLFLELKKRRDRLQLKDVNAPPANGNGNGHSAGVAEGHVVDGDDDDDEE
jgi:hypothetical protein